MTQQNNEKVVGYFVHSKLGTTQQNNKVVGYFVHSKLGDFSCMNCRKYSCDFCEFKEVFDRIKTCLELPDTGRSCGVRADRKIKSNGWFCLVSLSLQVTLRLYSCFYRVRDV